MVQETHFTQEIPDLYMTFLYKIKISIHLGKSNMLLHWRYLIHFLVNFLAHSKDRFKELASSS